MDKIELRVERFEGKNLDAPLIAVFGLAGGTVGRAGQNKLILQDKDGGVARVHAMVRLGSEEAYIANLCDSRAMYVNGQELKSGDEVALTEGASITIGPYELTAGAPGAERSPRAPTQTAPDTAPPAPAHSVAEAAPQTSEPTTSPVFSVPTFQSAPAPAPDLVDPPAPKPPRSLYIPESFDPFAAASPPPKDEWGGLQGKGLSEISEQTYDGLIKSLPLSGPMDDQLDNPAHSGLPKGLNPQLERDPLVLFGQSSLLQDNTTLEVSPGRGSELAQVFHLPTTTPDTRAATPSPPTSAPFGASRETIQTVESAGLQSVQGLDLSLFGQDTPAHSVFAQAAPPPFTTHAAIQPMYPAAEIASSLPGDAIGSLVQPASTTAFGMPLHGETTVPSAPVETPRQSHSHAPLHNANLTEQLSKAFMEGAGIADRDIAFSVTPEFMRMFGEAFRLSIEGTIDLLAARAEIKQEFRAGVTIIASSANNPLKFLPNADGVIMQMLGQQFPGFMKPIPAMSEAYGDLRVHQIALMAGIRAAYTEAITRFNPQNIEGEVAPSGLLEKLFEGNKKSALWDRYLQSYQKIRNAAEDDLIAFSGQTFVDAYEEAANTARNAP